MKISIYSTNDIKGGAAISAYRLCGALNSIQGVESKMFVQSKYSNSDFVEFDDTLLGRVSNSALPYLDRSFVYGLKIPTTFSTGLFGNNFIKKSINKFKPDIVHLQWVQSGFLSLNFIRSISSPIVWRLPDWWLITGGCHLPEECENYRTGCGNCPLFNNAPYRDITKNLYQYKFNSLKNLKNITYVAPSKSLADDIRNSEISSGNVVKVIPNGVDINLFTPLDKFDSKLKLKLDPHEFTVLFGAPNAFVDKNKGFQYLIDALLILKLKYNTIVKCISFGGRDGTLLYDSIEIRSFGVIKNNLELSMVYSAADLMLIPSIQESFCQVAIEAMACGTPVLSFNTTGLLDIIEPGLNGDFAELKDSEHLAFKIFEFLTLRNKKLYSLGARQTVINKFNIKSVAQQYLDLYSDLL